AECASTPMTASAMSPHPRPAQPTRSDTMSLPRTEPAPPATAVAPPRPGRGPTLWPLSLALAGVLGLTATLVFDTRAGDQSDPNLIITAADVAELENTMFRIGGFLGYLCVGALLVSAAVWHRRVALRHAWSAGAPVFTYGL